jgi:hypothetical protein
VYRTRSAGEATKVEAHRGHTAVAEALILAGANVNVRPDTSKAGSEGPSAAGLIRDSGVSRLVDLLEGREKHRSKPWFWSALFGH